jgi:hypothetical protein
MLTAMATKELITTADRLQRKVLEICRALANSTGHGALLPPAIAFMLADARDDAFQLQKEIAQVNSGAAP